MLLSEFIVRDQHRCLYSVSCLLKPAHRFMQVPMTASRGGLKFRVEAKKNAGKRLLIMKCGKSQVLQVKGDTDKADQFMLGLLVKLRDGIIEQKDLKSLKEQWMRDQECPEPHSLHACDRGKCHCCRHVDSYTGLCLTPFTIVCCVCVAFLAAVALYQLRSGICRWACATFSLCSCAILLLSPRCNS